MFWKFLAVCIHQSSTGDAVTACYSSQCCLTSSPHMGTEQLLLPAPAILSLAIWVLAGGGTCRKQSLAQWHQQGQKIGLLPQTLAAALEEMCPTADAKTSTLWRAVFLSLGCLLIRVSQMNGFSVMIRSCNLFNWSYHWAPNRRHKSFYSLLS